MFNPMFFGGSAAAQWLVPGALHSDDGTYAWQDQASSTSDAAILAAVLDGAPQLGALEPSVYLNTSTYVSNPAGVVEGWIQFTTATSGVVDPGVHTGHKVHVSAEVPNTAQDIKVALYQGGTVIDDTGWLSFGSSNTPAWKVLSVGAGDAANITNYNDLRVRVFKRDSTPTNRHIKIHQIYVEIPWS